MLRYELNPVDFKPKGKGIPILVIDKNNFTQHLFLIQECIDAFNAEIQWSEMFDLQLAVERLVAGKRMYVAVVDGALCGYVWSEMQRGCVYVFNIFMRGNVQVKALCTGGEFFSQVVFTHLQGKCVFADVDEWNIRSIKLLEGLGFVNNK
jgi:hypothetical protein